MSKPYKPMKQSEPNSVLLTKAPATCRKEMVWVVPNLYPDVPEYQMVELRNDMVREDAIRHWEEGTNEEYWIPTAFIIDNPVKYAREQISKAEQLIAKLQQFISQYQREHK